MWRSDGRRLIIATYRWVDGDPRLRIRPVDGRSEAVSAVGFAINYRVDDPPRRHCPGRRLFRSEGHDYLDCMNRPQTGSKRCANCAVAEAMLAASLHHAHVRHPDDIDPDVDAHLRQPNLLYLAGFADGSTKVGTSTAGRIEQRLLEQGAWEARIVGRAGDGIVVRQLEDLVTERLAIPQSVSNRRKLAGLVAPLTADHLADTLDRAATEVRRLIAEVDAAGVEPRDEHWENPIRPGLHLGAARPRLHRYPHDPTRGCHRFTIMAMIGRLAVIERAVDGVGDRGLSAGAGGDRFVMDLGRLFGLELEPGSFEPDDVLIQDALF